MHSIFLYIFTLVLVGLSVWYMIWISKWCEILNTIEFGTIYTSSLLWSVGIYKYTQQHSESTYTHPHDMDIVHTQQGNKACVVNRSVKTFPQDYTTSEVDHLFSTYTTLYIQNLDRNALPQTTCHIVALPLGVDFHTIATKPFWGIPQTSWQNQEKHLLSLRNKALPLVQRKRKTLVTWNNTSTTSNRHTKNGYKSRPQLWKECMSNSDVFDIGTGNRNETWKKMSQYAFVYSPIGDGFDCHRTWEALALGCIVIAQSNPTIKEFVDKYPIILHDDPDKITQEDLQRWQQQYTPATLEDLQIRNFLNFN